MRRRCSEQKERFVLCSERIVLECRCGERLILLGLEDDWRSERTVFNCDCGERITLADRLDEEMLVATELLRHLRAPGA